MMIILWRCASFASTKQVYFWMSFAICFKTLCSQFYRYKHLWILLWQWWNYSPGVNGKFSLKYTTISLVLNESPYSLTFILPATSWMSCWLLHVYVGTVWTRHRSHIGWTIPAFQYPLCSVKRNLDQLKLFTGDQSRKLDAAWQQTHEGDGHTHMHYRKILRNICAPR